MSQDLVALPFQMLELQTLYRAHRKKTGLLSPLVKGSGLAATRELPAITVLQCLL